MDRQRFPLKWVFRVACIFLGGCVLFIHPAMAQEKKENLEGYIDLLYRSVSVDGSSRKYEEDFDGLDSGGRIGALTLNWDQLNSEFADYASLNLAGLGGDPFESTSLRMGRKDVYDFTFRHRKQNYLYNLFELIGDEDGQLWNTERRLTDLNLSIHPSDNLELVFTFYEGKRTGESFVMKDIERDLFRLETPLDQVVRRYTVGANLELGPVDILFRQTLRRYDNQFDNFTKGDAGLNLADSTTLDDYEWIQNDSGSADLTTINLHTPLGERVDLTVAYFGTLFSDEEIKSGAVLNATGTDFSGAGFTITNGFSNADVEMDTTLLDIDLSVRIIEPLIFHLQYRSLDRDAEGIQVENLDGAGVNTANTRLDHSLDTITGILEYHPISSLTLRAGFRTIDRELIREGFGTAFRNENFKSDDDETAIYGISWRPAKWLKVSADHEEGEITQAFTQIAPFESEHTRVRATITPQPDMRINLQFLDFSNDTNFVDTIDTGQVFASSTDGDTFSASFWHRASDWVNYLFSYSRQEFDSASPILFDIDPFGNTDSGNSLFNNENTIWSGQINLIFDPAWKFFLRFSLAESEGDNFFLGTSFSGDISTVAGLPPGQRIDQDYTDWEAGLTYSFASGLFAGGSVRSFDYDDQNNLLDYDGEILTLHMGMKF